MIILDDTHYQGTAEQIAGLEAGQIEARERAARDDGEQDPLIRKLEEDAYTNLIAELRGDLQEYDDLKAGKIRSFSATGFLKMPYVLVKARLARGLTVKGLAELLGIEEARIREWELNDYQTASFVEMADVALAFDIDFSCQATLRDENRERPPRRSSRNTSQLPSEEPALTR